MPVYNVGNRIKGALMSALNQDFEELEFLIIDDKGSDNSIEIAKEIIGMHPRGKYVRIIDHIVNKGTGATKNTAMDNANGDYIFFMDSDDYITPDCISKLYKLAESKNYDVVSASYCIYDEHKKPHGSKYLGNFSGSSLAKHIYVNKEFWPVQTWNKLYKLSFLRENNVRCIPHHLCEDVYFQFQVINCCNSFASINDITYIYMLYENSATAGGQGYRYKFAKMFGEATLEKYNYIKARNIQFKEHIVNEIVKNIQWVLFKTRTSTYMTVEEKQELTNKHLDYFELMLNDQLFENFAYLRELIADARNNLNTEKLENASIRPLPRLKTLSWYRNKITKKFLNLTDHIFNKYSRFIPDNL